MAKTLKPILAQLLWLLVALIVSLLVTLAWTGWGISSTVTVDIHFHDTYYVITSTHIFITLFLLTSFVVFLLKELKHKYSRLLPDIIIFFIGILLIIAPSYIRNFFPSEGGWTFYPPLSALSDPEPDASSPFNILILVWQVFLVLVLLHVAYKLGRSKKDSQ